RVVVETHSSMLLLGVETLVAEGKLAPDKVKLHWFRREKDGRTVVQSGELDEAGRSGDWPEDFDDVTLKAQKRYLDAANKHMSARDIMRKDKGLNGDLDRLPMFTWVLFLKFLDDMEQMREEKAKLGRQKFRPAIEPPYRWRDWAAKEEGVTGPELTAFINYEE